MRAKVTEQGVVIPRDWLAEVEEVEIREEDGRIVITPVPREDPILALGRNPVDCGAPDASERHDRYLYGGPES